MREVLKKKPIIFKQTPPGVIRINDGLFTNETLPTINNESIDVNYLDDEFGFWELTSMFDEDFFKKSVASAINPLVIF